MGLFNMTKFHSCSKHNYTGTEPCPDCSIETIRLKFDIFTMNQKDIPQEYIDIINKHFWELI